ncbi:MAG: peptidoglycan DD-metalloendopeptidase family protein [Georgfuchsia sp.]
MNFRASFFLLGCVTLLAGCASSGLAPVINRAPPQVIEPAASVELKPGDYLVKKGDTLYSIALDHGHDYREIVAWNNLANPDLINIGQVLRIVPPDLPNEREVTGSETRPIAPPPLIETRPVDNRPAAVVESLKREPKGGTEPYTNEAWARIQKPAPAVAAAPAPQSSPVEPAKIVPTTDVEWAWPSSNKVAATFSVNNKGIDFDGKTGDPVLAAASGKVTLVTDSLRGYGNLIVVKHNSTYLSVYAHNSKMLVTEGQTVSQGHKIAEIGSSDSDHPNLHFEIRRQGKPVDPAKFLPQR